MKSLLRPTLALALILAPAAHAAPERPCDELLERVLRLDRQILCESQNTASGAGGANLALMLERNYLADLHNSIECRSRDLATPAARYRTGQLRLNCSK